MMPTELHEWERLPNNARRMRTPGGWLYTCIDADNNPIALAFVPKPDPPEQDPELLAALRHLQAESRETKEERARIRGIITEALLFDENEPYDHDARIELRKACRAVLDQLENR